MIANPPLPVHLTQEGICLLTDDTVSITSFKGISALYPAQAIVADANALTVAQTTWRTWPFYTLLVIFLVVLKLPILLSIIWNNLSLFNYLGFQI